MFSFCQFLVAVEHDMNNRNTPIAAGKGRTSYPICCCIQMMKSKMTTTWSDYHDNEAECEFNINSRAMESYSIRIWLRWIHEFELWIEATLSIDDFRSYELAVKQTYSLVISLPSYLIANRTCNSGWTKETGPALNKEMGRGLQSNSTTEGNYCRLTSSVAFLLLLFSNRETKSHEQNLVW